MPTDQDSQLDMFQYLLDKIDSIPEEVYIPPEERLNHVVRSKDDIVKEMNEENF